jgi:AbrB family looped-hinge helix DNA binding protein
MKQGERLTRTVRALRGGQITIPAEFRKRLGLTEESLLQVTLEDGELRLRPVRLAEPAVGSPWLKELYAIFAPWRQIAEERGYSEEEINAEIDAALADVRARHG